MNSSSVGRVQRVFNRFGNVYGSHIKGHKVEPLVLTLFIDNTDNTKRAVSESRESHSGISLSFWSVGLILAGGPFGEPMEP